MSDRYYVLALWELRQKLNYPTREQAKEAAIQSGTACAVVKEDGITRLEAPVWYDKDPDPMEKVKK
jgi:hypothetical protein